MVFRTRNVCSQLRAKTILNLCFCGKDCYHEVIRRMKRFELVRKGQYLAFRFCGQKGKKPGGEVAFGNVSISLLELISETKSGWEDCLTIWSTCPRG